MDTKAFTHCCGLAEIGDFPDSYDEDYEKFPAELKAQLEKATGFTGDPAGAIIATTTADQRGAIKQLRANNFKALVRFKNPNSGNWVTLWFKNMERPPADF